MKDKNPRLHAMMIDNVTPEQACSMTLDTCKKIAKAESLSVEMILLHSISKQLLKAKIKHGGFKETATMSFNWNGGECPAMAILHGAICLYIDEHRINIDLEWSSI